ncbi:MAG TPA: hypothetical protein VF649_06705 [Sphingomonas sp.]|jgi:hypothetical protein|uniref:hypothetical protein n=1 Tax=Sphingomonas sp. TaxID=28214 RepID=UPI002EDA171C
MQPARPAAPSAVAVATPTRPPAELLACPVAPEGFPRDAEATMPPAVRFAAIRLATAYAALARQLGRLIDWNDPASCPEAR